MTFKYRIYILYFKFILDIYIYKFNIYGIILKTHTYMNNYESKNVCTNPNGSRNDICIFCQWLLMTYMIKIIYILVARRSKKPGLRTQNSIGHWTITVKSHMLCFMILYPISDSSMFVAPALFRNQCPKKPFVK